MKLAKSQTPLKSYSIVKRSSTKCILKPQSSAPTVSYYTNNNKSLMINQNTILLDEGKLLIK